MFEINNDKEFEDVAAEITRFIKEQDGLLIGWSTAIALAKFAYFYRKLPKRSPAR